MILAGLGPVWILSQPASISREARLARWARGFGTSVLSATLGLAISLRQILLHILPDDPGFGSPVFGYHLYSWAFVIFIVILFCSGGCLIFTTLLAPAAPVGSRSKLTLGTIGLFGLLILANALVVSYKAVTDLLLVGELP